MARQLWWYKYYVRCVRNTNKEAKVVPVRIKRHAMQEYLHIFLTFRPLMSSIVDVPHR